MSDAVKEVLARIGELALAGRVPPDRRELEGLLRDEGHAEEAVRAALGGGPPPEGESPVDVVQLSEDATRFLNALRDLGYLDDDMEDEALDAVLSEVKGPIQLSDLRRHVAAVLFERQYELDDDTLRFLGEEWRLAFH